jgi:putative ATP-dependent endonuclease of OLD family
MRLANIEVRNFRCLRCVSLPIHELTVLIGENDSGKSSVLDLLDMVLNEKQPDENDFFQEEEGTPSELIEVELTFELDNIDRPMAEAFTAADGRLYLRKVFSISSVETYYRGERFVDDRLHQDFARMKVGELDEVLAELGIVCEGRLNRERRLKLIEGYKEEAETREDWILVQPAELRDVLPRLERYKAIDYQDPASFVLKTLQTVYEDTIFETTEDDRRRPVEPLRTLKKQIEAEINDKVNELLAFAKRYNRRVRRISFDPTIDFSRGLRTGEFLVDDGQGLRYLSKKGDGTKRRIFMATLDWDRQVLSERAGSTRAIIRGYDEPDANLHYEAQRMMYNTISDIVYQEDSRVQAVICTHSLTMIDRAPATSINLLSLSENGCTVTSFLRTDDDPEVEEFLHLLACELGITNTMMFYERCYVLVEGPTEENALPILYRRMYGRSIIDDGIRLINIEGKGGRKGLLKLLGKNRQEITLSLIDPDADVANELGDAGFSRKTIEQNVLYIGDREFEDAFADEVLCACLSEVWPRTDGAIWMSEHLRPLRENADAKKFSSALLGLVYQNVETGPECKKHVLGVELAKRCPLEHIPAPIIRLFQQARIIAGID